MFDVWIAQVENNRLVPKTKVPQHHATVEEALACAGHMLQLLGASALKARNTNVLGVHPTNCIAVEDPEGSADMVALVVGASLTDDEGKVSPLLQTPTQWVNFH
jgi:hypothetical protein